MRPPDRKEDQAAAGWIRLFDGATTFGWSAVGDARFSVESGALHVGRAGAIVTTTAFASYDLDVQFVAPASGAALLVGTDAGGKGGERISLPSGTKTQRLHVEVRPRELRFAFTDSDDKNQTQRRPVELKRGHIALTGADIAVRSVNLKPVGLDELFNGRDITGWTVFPGKKSRFTVVGGVLRVQDGPGDLQSVAKFGDFILQLECLSHGKHLNSGLFFRARPGEYQQGYEAQIRNEFTAEPRQEYVVEDFDPNTHEFLGNRKVRSTAVDYGTGAIYRRQPARQEAAKDGAWFTMTVVAHGNHIATWVDGVQETDWYDNRPPSDNARNGCRLAAGPVSLQGHDPTTDLSFRHIRAKELP